MKYFVFFLLLISTNIFAQSKQDSCCLAKQELVGVWQRNSPRYGDELEQNFQFYADGKFEVDFGDDGDDARDIQCLRGRYRMVKNELFLTITSRVVSVGGRITTAEPIADANIFKIDSSEYKEIVERNPREMDIPCLIVIIKKGHIKINNEIYYKMYKLHPKEPVIK